ncbi:MAG: LysE family translocator [Terriglobales bacterium]|jgi:threonine/homoserine/homoserine lactone efflux protein
MPDLSALGAFCAAAFLLNIAPGPDMLYVIGRSIGQGRRAGTVSALGIFAGCLVHIFIAAVGLAAVLRSSSILFNTVRYAGAAYLTYLGLRVLFEPARAPRLPETQSASLSRIFVQGVITNVLNPKVALFFLAFLPQFIQPQRGSIAFQIIVLGLIFDTGGTIVNLAVAQAGGRLADVLREHSGFARLQKWLTGTIFIGLGLRVAWKRS